MHVVFIVSINRKMKLLDPIEIYRKCSNLKKNCLQLVFFHWSVWIFYFFFLISWTFGSTYTFLLWVFNMKAHWKYLLLLTFLYYSLFYLSFPIKFCSLCCRWLRNRLSHFLILFLTYLCYPSAPWPRLACVNVMTISTQLSITWQELNISARAHNSQHTTPNHHENIITAAAWK